MAAIKWFRVQVFENDQVTDAYFYETDAGLFDIQFGWANFTGKMHDSLKGAMDDFRDHVQAEHDAKADGVQVSLGNPVEVPYDEVRKASPSKNAGSSP